MASPVTEILHELIDASRHMLSPNRVGELHALADAAERDASAVAEAAGVVADVAAEVAPEVKSSGAATPKP